MRVYEQLHQGASGRLLTMLEQNNASERDARAATLRIQEAAINAQAKDNKRRDWMAYSLIVIALAASGLFAFAGLPWLSGGTFAALIGYVALGFFKWRTH
jgi:hypothetical protein